MCLLGADGCQLRAATNLLTAAWGVHAFALCVRVGRWLLQYRKSGGPVLEPIIESMAVLQVRTRIDRSSLDSESLCGHHINRGHHV